MDLGKKLREEGVGPSIKHRKFQPNDHAHNAQTNGPHYRQRGMCESIFLPSSARSATLCMRELGTVNSAKSF
jgi:IS5 family transposase